MWHTLAQAIKLTGRSRRSLYRDMDAGRVSYRVRDDGRRELETSELMRAYGALKGMAQDLAQDVAQVGTGDGTSSDEQFKALIDELKQLRNEVRELRETLLLLEHKPAQRESSLADDSGETKSESSRQGQPVQSFADLLAALNDLN